MNVAFAGDDSIVGDLADVVARRGGSVVPVSDADVVVAIGESALFDLVCPGLEVPVLPIAAGEGDHVVSKPDAQGALAAVLEGRARRTRHYQLGVEIDGERVATALYDLTLVTDEPARISEYAVVGDGDPLGTVRSDGIVAATPAGSAGYARSAGGPVLSPGSGISVVPISPFTTHPEAWVVADEVCVTVTREEDVLVIADGADVCSVGCDESVAVTRTDPVTLLRS
ncbi:NAD+ kinase [Halalkaliarchaeum desulfuricum]|uniref:NAD+ kinase n=1 Tax=Halalkaliarchaeum desulfuricum TaxID=2055893 RepID=A0A343TFU7_9EURY|nr:NAD(+)/NADH kinase [Halalkaliarchaeum desulfuricum]AUX07969.1 NAD+ kinase [Halalkaliarchaeum desulfuricum]